MLQNHWLRKFYTRLEYDLRQYRLIFGRWFFSYFWYFRIRYSRNRHIQYTYKFRYINDRLILEYGNFVLLLFFKRVLLEYGKTLNIDLRGNFELEDSKKYKDELCSLERYLFAHEKTEISQFTEYVVLNDPPGWLTPKCRPEHFIPSITSRLFNGLEKERKKSVYFGSIPEKKPSLDTLNVAINFRTNPDTPDRNSKEDLLILFSPE